MHTQSKHESKVKQYSKGLSLNITTTTYTYISRSSYHRDRSNDRPRSHGDTRSNRWERESSRDRRLYGPDDLPSSRSGGRHLNGRGWDRDYIHGDDYWPDDLPHNDYGGERSRGRRGGGNYAGDSQSYPERYIVEARRKKHEADKMQVSLVLLF